MIKERGGRGRARAVLINFFPFLTYIYIYTIFLLLLSTVSQPPFSKGIGGRGEGRINSISRELSHSIIAILGLQGRRLTKIYIIFVRMLASIGSIENE